MREAAEDYEQDGGSGAVVPEPPAVEDGPAFAERLKSLIAAAKARLDDASKTASQRNASTTADERSAQQAEASARALQREASRAVDALPSDTRSKLASIKKKCAALRDAEKDAAQHLDEDAETEDDARAARPRRPVVWRRLHAIDATRSDRVARPQSPAQVEDVYKAAEDLNVFEWARIDKGDDDLALETLVSTPLAQNKPDAFQVTALRGNQSFTACSC